MQPCAHACSATPQASRACAAHACISVRPPALQADELKLQTLKAKQGQLQDRIAQLAQQKQEAEEQLEKLQASHSMAGI
jgi:hypothetical protein